MTNSFSKVVSPNREYDLVQATTGHMEIVILAAKQHNPNANSEMQRNHHLERTYINALSTSFM